MNFELFSKRKFTKYIDVYANRIKTIGNLIGEERNPDAKSLYSLAQN